MEPIETHKIEMVPISKLSLLKNNPRTITKDAFTRLCDSLINDPMFLKCRPILVNEVDDELIVYAGNQRARAAKKLKWKEVPCIIEKNVSEDLIKQRVLKDNRHDGEFDYDILAADYDIDTLIDCGFTTEELHLGLSKDENDESENDDNNDEDECKCPNCGKKMKKQK